MKKKVFLAGFVLLFFAMVSSVGAATLVAGENITLPADTDDDVYIAGGNLIVDHKVSGDVVAVGGQILISSDVTGDVLTGGGSVSVTGAVGDDLRVGGGNVTITSAVKDDIIVGGGSLTIGRGSVIGGDLVVGGGSVIIDGTVEGRTRIWGGNVIINGTLMGQVDIKADTLVVNGTIGNTSTLVAQKFELGTKAQFQNDVTYWRQGSELNFGTTVINGVVKYDPSLKPFERLSKQEHWLQGLVQLAFWMSILTGALLIALIIAGFSMVWKPAAEKFAQAFWKHTGLGLLYFIFMPLVAVVAFLTVIGWPIGLLLLVAYLFSLYLAKVFAAVVIAAWLNQKYQKNWKRPLLALMAVAVFIVLKLLMFIPVIGWLALVIIVSAAFGSLLVVKLELYKKFNA